MDIQEVIAGAKAYLHERTSSPLMVSFIIAWLIWNFPAVLIALSSTEIEKKLGLLDAHYSEIFVLGWAIDPIIYGVLGPIVSVLAYIYYYPKPAKWYYNKLRTEQNELISKRIELDGKTPVDQDEHNKILQALYAAEEALESTTTQHGAVVSKLREELQAEKAQNASSATPQADSLRYKKKLEETQKSLDKVKKELDSETARVAGIEKTAREQMYQALRITSTILNAIREPQGSLATQLASFYGRANKKFDEPIRLSPAAWLRMHSGNLRSLVTIFTNIDSAKVRADWENEKGFIELSIDPNSLPEGIQHQLGWGTAPHVGLESTEAVKSVFSKPKHTIKDFVSVDPVDSVLRSPKVSKREGQDSDQIESD
ncbi:MAG: hypothetical protein AAF542_00090 [Pseudomonadota bacterium]